MGTAVAAHGSSCGAVGCGPRLAPPCGPPCAAARGTRTAVASRNLRLLRAARACCAVPAARQFGCGERRAARPIDPPEENPNISSLSGYHHGVAVPLPRGTASHSDAASSPAARHGLSLRNGFFTHRAAAPHPRRAAPSPNLNCTLCCAASPSAARRCLSLCSIAPSCKRTEPAPAPAGGAPARCPRRPESLRAAPPPQTTAAAHPGGGAPPAAAAGAAGPGIRIRSRN
jgi:hypothetical protein